MLRALLLPAGALFLAFGSVAVERRGPDYALYCGEEPDSCHAPRLNGGWPAPFLFDSPNTSVVWKLSFGEDEFRPAPFVATASFHLLLLGALAALVRRLRCER